jgi:hypothetical protein
MMRDQSFRTSLRMVIKSASANPQLFLETISQVYKKRPDKVRSVLLRKWRMKIGKKDKGDKDDDDMQLDFGPGMGEEVVNFAFQPSARRDFKYRIVGRDLVGSHLVYRIAFTPRSPLDPTTPSGLVWVDTNEFVIVRQEVGFERSPVPLFLKGIPRMVIERTRVGDYWVLKRMLMRVQTTVPIPKIGSSFDIAVSFDDYKINQGLSDSLFTAAGATRGQESSR